MEHYLLPQHPLWEKGYTRVGDWHSSSAVADGAVADGDGDKSARFDGRAEECGLHTSGAADE
jgi:phosphoadenosine phosphosulfate reductase